MQKGNVGAVRYFGRRHSTVSFHTMSWYADSIGLEKNGFLSGECSGDHSVGSGSFVTASYEEVDLAPLRCCGRRDVPPRVGGRVAGDGS